MQSGCEDTLDERYAIKFCFKLGKMLQKRMECLRLLFDHLVGIEHQFLSGIRSSGKVGSLCGIMCGRSKEVKTPELIGQKIRVRVIFVAASHQTGLDTRSKARRPFSPTPPLGQDMTHGQFLSGVLQV